MPPPLTLPLRARGARLLHGGFAPRAAAEAGGAPPPPPGEGPGEGGALSEADEQLLGALEETLAEGGLGAGEREGLERAIRETQAGRGAQTLDALFAGNQADPVSETPAQSRPASPQSWLYGSE